MAESMDMKKQIALFKKYRDKDCIACSEGHSYNLDTYEIEPCWCLNLLIEE